MSTVIDPDYYIFDYPLVQGVLLALYSIVFIFCFFGNLAVVVVMTCHWRMKSITKYCIGNLAFANMSVGIFCVYQNFPLFIMGSWPFGSFLCKMFHFVNSLSHTASVLILVVISVERYIVILHPLKCKRILTIRRLRLTILGVWLLSGVLCLPRILYVILIRNPQVSKTGEVTYDVICSIGSHLFPSQTMEMAQFVLLFLLPLLIISILYFKVGRFLTKRDAFSEAFVSTSFSECETEASASLCHAGSASTGFATVTNDYSHCNNHDCQTSSNSIAGCKSRLLEMNRCMLEKILKRKSNRMHKEKHSVKGPVRQSSSMTFKTKTSCSNCRKHTRQHKKYPSVFKRKKFNLSMRKRLLLASTARPIQRSVSLRSLPCESRLVRINFSGTAMSCKECSFFCSHSKYCSPHRSHQDAVKLLIIIVVTFAVCNFPFHLRKIYQNYFYKPQYESDLDELATPVSFLLMYANCAINPIVYAFMSKNFRRCLMDVINCRCKRASHV